MQQQPYPNQPYTQQPGMPPQAPGVINTQQPQQNWMPQANPIAGVPAGLEYLSQIDQLVIKQKVELLEMMTDLETANKYKIKNSMGQDVYSAKEQSGFCMRQCCGPQRGFRMSIKDHTNREVISCKRPFKCFGGCPCTPHEMTIESPITGEVLGKVKQNWHLTHPRFTVYDNAGNPVFKMHGPCCGCNWCSDVNFKVDDMNGTQVGLVQKQWTGILKEAYTDADNFSVSFPIDLDVRLKAVLLGAVFLIDFMYFEQASNNNNH